MVFVASALSCGMGTSRLTYAPDAWKLLKGVFCVYKPAGTSIGRLRKMLICSLCKDLNKMEARPSKGFVTIDGNASLDKPWTLTVNNVPSIADNPLVVGPRYQDKDFRLAAANHLGPITSGLCVMAINDHTFLSNELKKGRHVKVYQITGRLGLATENHHVDGKIMEKSTYHHITQVTLDRILASIEAAHQRHQFHYMGVPPNTQEAYQLASQGLIRPSEGSPPLLYSIKCVGFKPPDFALEIHCINETEDYLLKFVHELGLHLKSTAVTTRLRSVRFGGFDVEVSLLRKHWTLEHILTNITQCKPLTKRGMTQPRSPFLTPRTERQDGLT